MNIRKAIIDDLSRVAEIYVFNNRINFFPIFKDEVFSFGELQVVPLIDNYFKREDIIENIYVYDNGIIKGFIQMNGAEICKLYFKCNDRIPCAFRNRSNKEMPDAASDGPLRPTLLERKLRNQIWDCLI